MYFHALALIIFNFIDLSHAMYYTISKDAYNIAGAPMQFNITVSESASPISFKFEFSENVTNSSSTAYDQLRTTKDFIFPQAVQPGIYRLNVKVFLVFNIIVLMKVDGPSYIDFEIKDKMGGKVKYDQNNLRQTAYSQSYVSCYNPITFKSEIDDFHNYFANVTYDWYINGTIIPNVTDNQMNYTINSEDKFNITTVFNATSMNNLTVTGRNELMVTAFKPLVSLNLTGIPNISWKRNKELKIYVNFVNGTKPFWQCHDIYSDDKTKLSCNEPEETKLDYFKVFKRFSHNGTYYLKIKAGNMVTKLEKSFPISVIDFEKKSAKIFIIMPTVAVILIFVILLSGVLYVLSRRSKFRTEVADFNFEIKSQVDALSEETFFQRLKSTFRNSIRNLFKCNQEIRFRQLNNMNSIEEIDA